MEEFDIIIIGAGSAGCVLAGKLSEDPKLKILLLEAGGENNSHWIKWPIGYGHSFTNPAVNWMQYSTPQKTLSGEALYLPRGKGLGGSSAVNAMVYTRSFKQDYDDWKVEGWSGDEFWQAYEEMETRIHNHSKTGDGPLKISKLREEFHPLSENYINIAKDCGYDETDMVIPQNGGVGDYQYTIHNGKRVSSATAFLNPAQKRQNLNIQTHAQVSKLITINGKVEQVEYFQNQMYKKARARRLVILSAGAYHSPKILQHSGFGDGNILQNFEIETKVHSPHIGRHMQDHLGISYHYKTHDRTLNASFGSFFGRLKMGARYLLTRKGPMALSVNQMGGFVMSTSNPATPDFQLYFNPLSFDRNEEELRGAKYPPKENGCILAFNSCRPTSEGTVFINSPNPLDDPLIDPNFLSSQKDQDDVAMGAQIIKTFEENTHFKNMIEQPKGFALKNKTNPQILEDFKGRSGTVFHSCSTARMSQNSQDGAVSGTLNLYGVEGLKVVDASVFGNVTSGNTNAPSMALAYIAAKRIAQELK